MPDRIFRKLDLSDLALILNMNADFRSYFICVDNVRQLLSNPMNWLFVCIEENYTYYRKVEYRGLRVLRIGRRRESA